LITRFTWPHISETPIPRQSKIIAIIVGFLLLGVPGSLIIQDSRAEEENPEIFQEDGDWIITNHTIVENKTITLNGNLTIMPGGNLTLINVTLLFNCSYDGQYGIEVMDGGELHVVGTKEVVDQLPPGAKDRTIYLFIGNSSGYVHWYQKNLSSSNLAWEFLGIVEDDTGNVIVHGASITFDDLDADSDLDMITGIGDGYLSYYENVGDNPNPVWKKNISMFEGVRVDYNADPNLADLDGDGDLDLTVGEWMGSLNYWENTGTPQAPNWIKDDTMYGDMPLIERSSSPAFCDLDGDGDLDLTVGLKEGPLEYYKNTGTPESPEWTRDTSMFSSVGIGSQSKPAFCDADGDGDYDLIIGRVNGNLHYFENTGTYRRAKWSYDYTVFDGFGVGWNSQPDFMEFDNVKIYDLVVGGGNGNLDYYKNTGTPYEPEWEARGHLIDVDGVEIDVGYSGSPTFVDIDGDGDEDLAIGQSHTYKSLDFYENTGTHGNPQWTYVPDYFISMGEDKYRSLPNFGDVDNDGDHDLALVYYDYGATLKYYENTGTPSEPIWSYDPDMFATVDISITSPGGSDFADLDDDGDLDFIIHSGNSGKLEYYENTGTPEDPVWGRDTTLFQDIDTSYRTMPVFADLDNDKDLDLTVGRSNGYVEYYCNTGTPKEAVWTEDNTMFSDMEVDYYATPAFGDLGPQVKESTASHETHFESTEDISVISWTEDPTMFGNMNPGWYTNPAFGDVDGDSDLTVTSYEGDMEYYENGDQNGLASIFKWMSDPLVFGTVDLGAQTAPATGDLDGDNDLDLLIGRYVSGAGASIVHLENTGTYSEAIWSDRGNITDRPGNTIDDGWSPSPILADLDNDGDLDLTFGDHFSNLFYYENTGTTLEAEWTRNDSMFIGINGNNRNHPAFIDIESDGDLDLVIGSGLGNLKLYRNTGSPSSPIWSNQGFIRDSHGAYIKDTTDDSMAESAPTFGDLDLDGDLDLLLGCVDGTIFRYENTGTPTDPEWTPREFQVDEDGTTIDCGSEVAPLLSDLDGDGDIDLCLGNATGGITYYEAVGMGPHGDYDLFVGGGNGELDFYENIGNTTRYVFMNLPMFSYDVGKKTCPEFGDLDGDGDFDLILGRRDPIDPKYGSLLYFENEGTRKSPQWTERGEIKDSTGQVIAAGYKIAPALADLDDDGDLDLAVGTYLDGFYYYNNTGDTNNPIWTNESSVFDVVNNASLSRTVPTFADVDNDGDFDLTVGDVYGYLSYFENIGTHEYPIWAELVHLHDSLGSDIMKFAAGPEYMDIDNDGDLDLFVGSTELNYYENTGTSNEPVWFSQGFVRDTFGNLIRVLGGDLVPAFVDLDFDIVNGTNPGEPQEEPDGSVTWFNSITTMGIWSFHFNVHHGSVLELRDMEIRNCGNSNSGQAGFVAGADYGLISGNHFVANNHGILVNGSSSSTIENNTFSDNFIGILIRNGSTCTVSQNIFNKNTINIRSSGSSDNLILENVMTGSQLGISLVGSRNETISWNNLNGMGKGIHLFDSTSCTVEDNIISGSEEGITLEGSREMDLVRNVFTGCGVLILGNRITDFDSHFIKDNTINDSPLYYYSSMDGVTVPENAASVIIANSSNVIVKDLLLNETTVGIQCAYVEDLQISQNILEDLFYGVHLYESVDTDVSWNAILGNQVGISVEKDHGTRIKCNRIRDNVKYGVLANGDVDDPVDAVRNYWGDPSGPYHPVQNPLGAGDNVSDSCKFYPWLNAPPGHNVWYVDDSAPDGGIGSIEQPFDTIQEAVDNASSGETIYVLPGLYRENIRIDRRINIFGLEGTHSGEDESSIIIDAMGETAFTILRTATLTNITIINASLDFSVYDDILLLNTEYVSIEFKEDCTISSGYYLDVIIIDHEGEPVPTATLSITNEYSFSKTFSSGPDGRVDIFSLIAHVRNSTSTTSTTPYYLNASHEYFYDNSSVYLNSDIELIMKLQHHAGFGTSVLTEDINGDGFHDYVIGAPYHGQGGWNAGSVYIIYGNSSKVLRELNPEDADIVLMGNHDHMEFGTSLAMNDIDQDGLEDLIILAPGSELQEGTVFLYSGELMMKGPFDLEDGITLTLNDEFDIQYFTGNLETGDIDCDGYPDILLGYVNGTLVYHGQEMVNHEQFEGEPIFDSDWDPIIAGEGSEVFVDSGFHILTGDDPKEYAYIQNSRPFTNGLGFSITLAKISYPYSAISGIDYKVPVEDISHPSKQLDHSLFILDTYGNIQYRPDRNGEMESITSYSTGSYITYELTIAHDFKHMTISVNGVLFVDTYLAGWSEIYLKLGDSDNVGRSVLHCQDFMPQLVPSLLPLIVDPVMVTIDGNPNLAVPVNENIRLIPLGNDTFISTSHSNSDDFNGTHVYTLFDNGLTITPYVFFELFPNGDFENGWKNWSQLPNSKGVKDAGRWEILRERNGYWYAFKGNTSGFGSDEYYFMGEADPCNGSLRSESVTIPENADYLSLWYCWYAFHFDLNDGDYPDKLSIELRNASDDSHLLTIAEYEAPYNGSYHQMQLEIQVNISNFKGHEVYLVAEIVTDGSEYDHAVLQLDEIFGADKNADHSGDFTSKLFTLNSSYDYVSPYWEEELNGGNLSIFLKTTVNGEWIPISNEGFYPFQADSYQFRVVIEGDSDNPYPILKNLNFNFFNISEESFGNGSAFAFDGGPIFEASTLVVVNGTRAQVFNGTEPAYEITSEHPIDFVNPLGDVDGNGIHDLLVSSDNSVYMVLLNAGNMDYDLSDSLNSFSGDRGFGNMLHKNLVGSPFENEHDGSAYVLPMYKNDCGIMGTNLANGSLMNPDTQFTIEIDVVNIGLEDAEAVTLTLNITGEQGYFNEESTTFSLITWNQTTVNLEWHIPSSEGTEYTISISLSDDHNINNNVQEIHVLSRYHELLLETTKDYNAGRPGESLNYSLKIQNTGTFGKELVTFSCDVPLEWDWWIRKDGINITSIEIEDVEDVELWILANTSIGIYSLNFTVISKNGVTTGTQMLVAHVVECDLTLGNISYLRDDGKIAQPVTGEITTVVVEIKNDGMQNAMNFEIYLTVDGALADTKNVKGLVGLSSINITFSRSFNDGNLRIGYVLDMNDDVKEFNETNNIYEHNVIVRPEYATSDFILLIRVFDSREEGVGNASVTARQGASSFSNETDIHGITVITISDSFKEGSVYNVEASRGDWYGSVDVRIYSEDGSANIIIYVGWYSVAVSIDENHLDINPGESDLFTLEIKNQGDFNDSFAIDLLGLPSFWEMNISGLGYSETENRLTLEKGATVTISIEVLTWKYSTAYERTDLDLRISSYTAPQSEMEVLLMVTVPLRENITIEADVLTRTGVPGDVLSYRVTFRNEGNLEKTVWIMASGDSNSFSLSRDRITIYKGTQKSVWLSVEIDNLRAGSTLDHHVYGVVEGMGPTPEITFTTEVKRITHNTRLLVAVDENALSITNKGNAVEYLELSITSEAALITLEETEISLDMGEAIEISLDIVMTDTNTPGGSLFSGVVSISTDISWYNTTHQFLTPFRNDLSISPMQDTIKIPSGTTGTFSLIVQNKGNIRDRISFSAFSSGNESVVVPLPVILGIGEEAQVSCSVIVPTGSKGSRVISFSGYAGDMVETTQLEVIIESESSISMEEISVRMDEGTTVYSINLMNEGDLPEQILLESNCGVLDLLTTEMEPKEVIQFHLFLPPDCLTRGSFIFINATPLTTGGNSSLLQLDPPPTAEITMITPSPGSILDTIRIQGSGNHSEYIWHIDNTILSGKEVSYNFSTSGSHIITLEVTDYRELTFSTSVDLYIPNLAPEIDHPYFLSIKAGEFLELNAEDSVDPDGIITDISWDIYGSTYHGMIVHHEFKEKGVYLVNLTVKDNFGATNTTTIQVTVTAGNGVHNGDETKKEVDMFLFGISLFILSVVLGGVLLLFLRMHRKETEIILKLNGSYQSKVQLETMKDGNKATSDKKAKTGTLKHEMEVTEGVGKENNLMKENSKVAKEKPKASKEVVE